MSISMINKRPSQWLNQLVSMMVYSIHQIVYLELNSNILLHNLILMKFRVNGRKWVGAIQKTISLSCMASEEKLQKNRVKSSILVMVKWAT